MFKILSWFRSYSTIILILVLASLLRFYRLPEYMTFLGDEGRDSFVWLKMVWDGKFTLIGPMTSIGNMYLGPLYYYLMLPFFIIFNLSPVGPSVGVALFSLSTIVLIWKACSEWFGNRTGLIAAFLYAISPVVIYFSRSSWNPNVMPFFALLTIWGVWQFWQKNRNVWLIIIGISLSFAIQSHYLGLLLIPVVGLFWLIKLFGLAREKESRKWFLLASVGSVLIFFILTFLPLIWFDLRHNGLNSKAFLNFFSDRQTTVNFKLYKAIPNIWPLWEEIITRLVAGTDLLWGKVIAVGIIVGSIVSFIKMKGDRKTLLSFALIFIWIIVGLTGLGVYKQHIYDHYFGFIFCPVFILLGIIISRVLDLGRIGKILAILTLAFLVYLNFANSPFKSSPNFQMQRVEEISSKIISESGSEPYNLGMIAKMNYDEGYRFYLRRLGKGATPIEPLRAKETITEQLFVVCEDPVCQPVGNPKTEIANFGWAKIAGEWSYPWGTKLYKLVHLD